MLKIREPIKLANRDIQISAGDGFYERITAGYSLMNSDISSEDLLHIVTQPPEVFLMEGDGTNIFNSNVNVENINSSKFEILNNLINRIMLSATDNFTYRDSVYITNVLRRLGITDVNSFMKQVFSIMEEHDNTRQQINLLTESINQYVLPERSEERRRVSESAGPSEATESTHSYYLHQRIMERLGTQRIYEIVAAFVNAYVPKSEVTVNQLSIAEQIRTGDHLHLQELQNEITMQAVPLVYQHENIYEEEQTEIVDASSTSNVSQSLTKAVLLSIVDKIYEVKGGDIHVHNNGWYHTANAFYESSSDTIERYARNLAMPILNEVRQSFTVSEIENNNILKQSLTQLVMKSGDEVIIENLQQVNEQNIQTQNLFIRALEGLRERQASASPERTGNQRARQKRESLMALENPEALLNGYREEERNAEPLTHRVGDEQFRSELPPEVRQYLEILEKITVSPAEFVGNTDSAMASLASAVNEIEEIKKRPESPILPDGTFRRIEPADTEAVDMVLRSAAAGETIYDENGNPVSPQELIENIQSSTERVIRNMTDRERITQSSAREIVERVIAGQTAETRIGVLDDEKVSEELLIHPEALQPEDAQVDEHSVQRTVRRTSEQETITTEMAERIVDKVVRGSSAERRVEEKISRTLQEVSFVHKETMAIDEEELIERLKEERVLNSQTNETVNETNETVRVVNRHEVTKEVVNETADSQKIAGMVSSSVSQQLDSLSEQVFRRLEKRLANEKRRRGI